MARIYWWRFVYVMFLAPFIAVYFTWRDGNLDLDEMTIGGVMFFIAWEIGVALLARWRRIWPFHQREG